MANCKASLPGRILERLTAWTKSALAINIPTDSLYNSPTEAGPEVVKMFTFMNNQNN
jgi:hypothetical protein